MRVIVIDDEPLLAESIARYLTPLYDHVVTATSFAEARDNLRKYPKANLVISDYNLGGGRTSAHLLPLLRQVGRLVLMTGDPSAVPEDFAATASVILEKPFGLDRLDAILP